MSGVILGLTPLETGGEETEGFQAPGVESFELPPLFEAVPWLDKYLLMAIVSVILVILFWVIMARKNSLVPGKAQFIGETAYFFVRNGIARDMIGHDFRRYLPFLIALFSFILVNNLWGIFPLTLVPTASHVGWAYGLALMVWVLYNGVGIAKHGFGGYLKHTTLPSGVPKAMWPIIIPLEFFSNIIVRPVTLSLRLFANMFAGHLLVLVFVLGGEYPAAAHRLHREQARRGRGLDLQHGDLRTRTVRPVAAGLHLHRPDRQLHRLGRRRRALTTPTPRCGTRERKQYMTPLELVGSLGIVGYGLGAIGPGIGVGLIFASVIQGTARQPEARGAMMGTAWIGFAVTEALAIIGIALAFVFGGL